jgi:myo-inositol 2-dehydrogenase / D-chiro-inositol 1-dehydrogenase
MAVRVGIIGAGNMGKTHGEVLRDDHRVTIAGIADVMPGKAEELAQALGTRAYPDASALLDADLDAVYVTTPNTKHRELVLDALGRNIHVFSEKPMATRLDEATQILETTRAGKVVYQVGHNRRFAPAYKYQKQQIEAGFVPFLINAKQNDGDWLNPPWITDLSLTGGFLYESSVHLLDMLRWLVGEVVSVQARAKANVYDVLNDFAILLTFEGERFAVFSSSAHASWAFPTEHVEIVGHHASIRSEELDRVIHSAGLDQPPRTTEFSQLARADKWGYREEDAAFISACLGERSSAVDAWEAFKSIELCEACELSALNGGEQVKLPLATATPRE